MVKTQALDFMSAHFEQCFDVIENGNGESADTREECYWIIHTLDFKPAAGGGSNGVLKSK
jgi:hypothetical protein